MELTFNDGSLAVQAAACKAVGLLGLHRHIPDLIARLGHYEYDVRSAALEGLECFTEEDRSFGFDQMQWTQWHEGG